MSLIEQDSAYFLHQIPYRDNSAIVHFLTRQQGKVSFIVSGLKAKKNAKRPFLQPCHELLIDYQLKPNLSKLVTIDFSVDGLQEKAPSIDQFMLYQYANELLLSILPSQLPTPTLFRDYRRFLQLLSEQRPHMALRHIELALIILFGGLPDITQTEDSKQAIEQTHHYWFYPDRGLFSIKQNGVTNGIALDGAQVQAFQHMVESYLSEDDDHINETLAQGAKALTTSLITPLLNGKPLRTRQIYHALQAFI